MSNIYTKKQNKKFDDFINEMNDSNPFTYNGVKDKEPNKLNPINVYWTHDKKGNLVLSEEYMLHLFRRQMMYYKKTYEKEVV
jgi:hypothetical protein